MFIKNYLLNLIVSILLTISVIVFLFYHWFFETIENIENSLLGVLLFVLFLIWSLMTIYSNYKKYRRNILQKMIKEDPSKTSTVESIIIGFETLKYNEWFTGSYDWKLLTTWTYLGEKKNFEFIFSFPGNALSEDQDFTETILSKQIHIWDIVLVCIDINDSNNYFTKDPLEKIIELWIKNQITFFQDIKQTFSKKTLIRIFMLILLSILIVAILMIILYFTGDLIISWS